MVVTYTKPKSVKASGADPRRAAAVLSRTSYRSYGTAAPKAVITSSPLSTQSGTHIAAQNITYETIQGEPLSKPTVVGRSPTRVVVAYPQDTRLIPTHVSEFQRPSMRSPETQAAVERVVYPQLGTEFVQKYAPVKLSPGEKVESYRIGFGGGGVSSVSYGISSPVSESMPQPASDISLGQGRAARPKETISGFAPVSERYVTPDLVPDFQLSVGGKMPKTDIAETFLRMVSERMPKTALGYAGTVGLGIVASPYTLARGFKQDPLGFSISTGATIAAASFFPTAAAGLFGVSLASQRTKPFEMGTTLGETGIFAAAFVGAGAGAKALKSSALKAKYTGTQPSDVFMADLFGKGKVEVTYQDITGFDAMRTVKKEPSFPMQQRSRFFGNIPVKENLQIQEYGQFSRGAKTTRLIEPMVGFEGIKISSIYGRPEVFKLPQGTTVKVWQSDIITPRQMTTSGFIEPQSMRLTLSREYLSRMGIKQGDISMELMRSESAPKVDASKMSYEELVKISRDTSRMGDIKVLEMSPARFQELLRIDSSSLLGDIWSFKVKKMPTGSTYFERGEMYSGTLSPIKVTRIPKRTVTIKETGKGGSFDWMRPGESNVRTMDNSLLSWRAKVETMFGAKPKIEVSREQFTGTAAEVRKFSNRGAGASAGSFNPRTWKGKDLGNLDFFGKRQKYKQAFVGVEEVYTGASQRGITTISDVRLIYEPSLRVVPLFSQGQKQVSRQTQAQSLRSAQASSQALRSATAQVLGTKQAQSQMQSTKTLQKQAQSLRQSQALSQALKTMQLQETQQFQVQAQLPRQMTRMIRMPRLWQPPRKTPPPPRPTFKWPKGTVPKRRRKIGSVYWERLFNLGSPEKMVRIAFGGKRR